MGQNFISKMTTMHGIGFYDGQRVGQQQILDFATVYLARLGWSGKQCVEFFNGVSDVADEFSAAYNPSQEQDVYQVKLDDELSAAYEGETDFLPFHKRYPDVKCLGYDKPIKQEERHPAAKKRGKGKRK